MTMEEQQQQWCEAVSVRAAWLTIACVALPVVWRRGSR